MYKRSFYDWLIAQRTPHPLTAEQTLANNVFLDGNFPKQSVDFDTISHYLEEHAHDVLAMTIFDSAWARYTSEQ